MNETAEVLGISVAAAKARLFHARTARRMNNVLLLKREAARPGLHKRFFLRTGCTVPFASLRRVWSAYGSRKTNFVRIAYPHGISNYCSKTGGGPLTRFHFKLTFTSTRLAILMNGMLLFIP
jgi:hypothetical protein